MMHKTVVAKRKRIPILVSMAAALIAALTLVEGTGGAANAVDSDEIEFVNINTSQSVTAQDDDKQDKHCDDDAGEDDDKNKHCRELSGDGGDDD